MQGGETQDEQMTYRGIVNKGMVVFEGDKPADGTVIEVTPVETVSGDNPATHPAIGIWSNRTDLPEDPVEASKMLRKRMMARDDE
jgi:hypothetical protein